MRLAVFIFSLYFLSFGIEAKATCESQIQKDIASLELLVQNSVDEAEVLLNQIWGSGCLVEFTKENPSSIALLHLQSSLIAYYRGNIVIADSILEAGISYALTSQDWATIARCKLQLSKYFKIQGKRFQSNEQIMEVLQKSDSMGNLYWKAKAYYELSAQRFYFRRFEESAHLFDSAFSILYPKSTPLKKAEYLLVKGRHIATKAQKDTILLRNAFILYDSARSIAGKAITNQLQSNYHIRYGRAMQFAKREALAKQHFHLALNYTKRWNNKNGIRKAFRYLGDVYYRFRRNGNYEENLITAAAYYDSSLVISRNISCDLCVELSLNMLSYIHRQLGNTENENKALRELSTLRLNLFKKESETELNQQLLEFNDERRRTTIALQKNALDAERRKNKELMFYIIAGILLAAATTLILVQRQKRLKAESEKVLLTREKTIEKLQNEKIIHAYRHLVRGQDEERKRIALELHDSLGSILGGTRLMLDKKVFREQVDLDPIRNMVDKAANDLRTIMANMMPSSIDKFGLYNALEETISEASNTCEIDIKFHSNIQTTELSKESSHQLFRVIQEGLRNAIKHGKAKHIEVSLIIDHVTLHLTIEDDGIGFTPSEKKENGFGLNSMSTRISSLGGILQIHSNNIEGTVIMANIPLKNMQS